jgi:hypothetical protein
VAWVGLDASRIPALCKQILLGFGFLEICVVSTLSAGCSSETDRSADGAGAMDAIYLGTSCWFGGCTGSGPWVQADLEYGLSPLKEDSQTLTWRRQTGVIAGRIHRYAGSAGCPTDPSRKSSLR